jgi:hypothetical protein
MGVVVVPPSRSAYGNTMPNEIDKKWIHFVQTLLKEHACEWWMSQKQETFNLFETLTWEKFKL